jgi:hypothetical protein
MLLDPGHITSLHGSKDQFLLRDRIWDEAIAIVVVGD